MSGKTKGLIILLLSFCIGIVAFPAYCFVPEQLSYQGRLTDAAGVPVPDSTYEITFTLYDELSVLEWTETQSTVDVTNGVFTTMLPLNPALSPFPPGLFDKELFLGIKVGSDGEMTPRQLLSSVPFSIKAGDADTFAGHIVADFADVAHSHDFSDVSGIVDDGQVPDDITIDYAVNAGSAANATSAANASDADNLDGRDSTSFADAAHNHDSIYAPESHVHDAGEITTGTIDPTLFSAYEDLAGEGYLDNSDGNDLLQRDQADGRYWKVQGNFGQYPDLFFGTLEPETLEFRVYNQHALRLEPGRIPNIIGGFSGNSAFDGAIGVTISGGGEDVYTNRVTDDFGTVGGGWNNQAGDGDGAPLTGIYATVGGGYTNTASGSSATVGGGGINTASGVDATVGGGFGNTASDMYATIGGGTSNIASEYSATVGGGYGNTASGPSAAVGGGYGNTASRDSATVGGGGSNSAAGKYATIPGGNGAKANNYGQMSYASGAFGYDAGSAQTSIYVLRNTTSGTDPSELFLDGGFLASERITVEDGYTMTFNILVVARGDLGNSAGYKIEGVIRNYSGTVSMVGSPSVVTLGEETSSWYANVAAGTTPSALRIWVGGGQSWQNIRWVARVETAEVKY